VTGEDEGCRESGAAESGKDECESEWVTLLEHHVLK